MSRRHHGRSNQGGRYRHDPARPAPGTAPATPTTPAASLDAAAATSHASHASHDLAPRPAPIAPTGPPAVPTDAPEVIAAGSVPSGPPPTPGGNGRDGFRPGPGQPNGHGPGPMNGQDRSIGCTAPQLRRFIKSRPYVPMHELRRRFAIDGGDDDVTQVSMSQGHVYVGLPSREGSLLGELLRGGEIGYELSLDPRTPVVVGVYPMRPVPRS